MTILGSLCGLIDYLYSEVLNTVRLGPYEQSEVQVEQSSKDTALIRSYIRLLFRIIYIYIYNLT